MSTLELLIRRVIKEERQRLKELTSRQEIDDLATNLLDFMGGSVENLPSWKADPDIVKYFRDNSITDSQEKIYRRAVELSQDNKPKSTNRKYLDN